MQNETDIEIGTKIFPATGSTEQEKNFSKKFGHLVHVKNLHYFREMVKSILNHCMDIKLFVELK